MYLGPMDDAGMWKIVSEPADNCIDEFLAGRNDECTIAFCEDGTVLVRIDNYSRH
jgi:DNA gyrase/topoisomerase IV subunit B